MYVCIMCFVADENRKPNKWSGAVSVEHIPSSLVCDTRARSLMVKTPGSYPASCRFESCRAHHLSSYPHVVFFQEAPSRHPTAPRHAGAPCEPRSIPDIYCGSGSRPPSARQMKHTSRAYIENGRGLIRGFQRMVHIQYGKTVTGTSPSPDLSSRHAQGTRPSRFRRSTRMSRSLLRSDEPGYRGPPSRSRSLATCCRPES